jgi:hypothetical protein
MGLVIMLTDSIINRKMMRNWTTYIVAMIALRMIRAMARNPYENLYYYDYTPTNYRALVVVREHFSRKKRYANFVKIGKYLVVNLQYI